MGNRIYDSLSKLVAKVMRKVDYLAYYRAKVVAQASDGSTLDVTPDDPRLAGPTKIKLLLGLPGMVAKVNAGCFVMFGFANGDPRLPYVHSFEAGAEVTEWDVTTKDGKIKFESGTGDITFNGGTKKLARVGAGDKVAKHGHTLSEFAGQYNLIAGMYTVTGTIATSTDSHDELEITVGGAAHVKA